MDVGMVVLCFLMACVIGNFVILTVMVAAHFVRHPLRLAWASQVQQTTVPPGTVIFIEVPQVDDRRPSEPLPLPPDPLADPVTVHLVAADARRGFAAGNGKFFGRA